MIPLKSNKKGVQDMDNNKERLTVSLRYDDSQTIPLALHEMHMARADRRLRWLCVAWALSLIMTVCAFVWLWCQYDYVSTTELSGVYNLVDSQGNVVSADIPPDDVIHILEELNGGQDQTDQKP